MITLVEWLTCHAIINRDPRLFEHPDLFSSCHFFGPKKFADIVKMINESNVMDRIQSNSQSSERILGYSTVTSSLQSDLNAVLKSYIGRQVLAKRRSINKTELQLTGTVVSTFIQKHIAYIVVQWHLNASKSVISLQQFIQGGQYWLVDRSDMASCINKSLSMKLKSRGAMKFT